MSTHVGEMALLTSASRDDLTRLVSIQELETKERAESNSVTFLMLWQASGAERQECTRAQLIDYAFLRNIITFKF